MVIGNTFVWAHLAKTGGNSTLRMFMFMKQEIVHWDDKDDPKKHHNFQEREKELGMDFSGKERYLNIRRLPAYILSHTKFQEAIYSVPPGDRVLQGVVNTGRSGARPGDSPAYHAVHIDDILRYYDYEKVAHWLRTEFLADDFLAYFGPYVEKKFLSNFRIRHTRDNVNTGYSHRVEDHFSADEIAAIYEACPIWAGIERQVYGDLLSERT